MLVPSVASPFGWPVDETRGAGVQVGRLHVITAPDVPLVVSAHTSFVPTRIIFIGRWLVLASGVGLVPQPVRAQDTIDPLLLPEDVRYTFVLSTAMPQVEVPVRIGARSEQEPLSQLTTAALAGKPVVPTFPQNRRPESI